VGCVASDARRWGGDSGIGGGGLGRGWSRVDVIYVGKPSDDGRWGWMYA